VLRFASSIRFKARRNGLKGVYLVSADDDPDNADPRSYLFDAKLSTSIIEPLPHAKSQINFLTKLAAFFAQYA
jgi:hypothetical protein